MGSGLLVERQKGGGAEIAGGLLQGGGVLYEHLRGRVRGEEGTRGGP